MQGVSPRSDPQEVVTNWMRDTEKEKATKIVIRGREDVRAGLWGCWGRADHPSKHQAMGGGESALPKEWAGGLHVRHAESELPGEIQVEMLVSQLEMDAMNPRRQARGGYLNIIHRSE